MHIVVIGWFFVAVMMAIGAQSITAAVITFFMWGVVPIGLILYIFGRRGPRHVTQGQPSSKPEATQADESD